MKTIWHWKNIGKSFLLVMLAGFLVALLPLTGTVEILVGMLAGAGAMIFSMIKWELWHFE